MACDATIAILRAAADVDLASVVRRILESSPHDGGGRLRIDELHCDQPEFFPDLRQQSRPDLAILIEPAETPFPPETVRACIRKTSTCFPLLVVVPESLAPKAPELLKAGASDFVLSPIRPSNLLSRVSHLLRPRESDDELIAYLKELAGSKQIVGRSPILLAQLRKVPTIASCDATVLITGETGTGKELCARAVHYCSRRSAKPFVPVDCGAIPAELIENELFGHERGAYTTAMAAQPGLLQEAEGGTLFLDEVDALSVPMQSKLLRLLQEKEYRPLGSPRLRHIDVRVIAASNISLEDAVQAGRFRQDLFYRLNVLSMAMPPLRDRIDDIPLLARHFLKKYTAEFSRPAKDIDDEAVEMLLSYRWPGNARELENIMERAVLACKVPLVEARDLELPTMEQDPASLCFQKRKDLVVAKWEREELKRILAMYHGNVSAAARAEAKAASAFRALLRKHKIRPHLEFPYWQPRT